MKKSVFPDISNKGVYCLIFKNKHSRLDAGSLKAIEFRKGYHVYVGSALGSGGLKRLKRHVMLSLQKDKKPRWHVDYLSVSSFFDLKYVVYAFSQESVECQLAEKLQELSESLVLRFGSGDCGCPSHLFYFESCSSGIIEKAFSELDIKCDTVCFDD